MEANRHCGEAGGGAKCGDGLALAQQDVEHEPHDVRQCEGVLRRPDGKTSSLAVLAGTTGGKKKVFPPTPKRDRAADTTPWFVLHI